MWRRAGLTACSSFFVVANLCGSQVILRPPLSRRGQASARDSGAGAGLGETTVGFRARPGQPARTSIVELRAVRVDLDGPWRLTGWPPVQRVVGLRCAGGLKNITRPLRAVAWRRANMSGAIGWRR